VQFLSDHTSSNEDLAKRAQRGCTSSFEVLLRRFQVPLLHFLRNVGPKSDAEDVLQETFLRACSRLHQYKPQWRFSTWLFTIARRTNINYHRHPRPAADHELVERSVSAAAGPEQVAVAAESRQLLWSAAARILGEEEFTALWLHYVEEMPIGEIAAILDRTSVSVKTMMFRSRKKLLPLVSESEANCQDTQPVRTVEASHG
jgi:RNA polymerase sigma-70 factor (ECF subfamily)